MAQASTRTVTMADGPRPFSRAKPRSEYLKRWNAMQEAKKKAEEEEISFSAESVIISTPAPATRPAPNAAKPFKPITNINYSGRVIDDILRKEDEAAAKQAAVNKKHHDSMDLLRKLSRVGTPSPPQPRARNTYLPPTANARDSGDETSPERKPMSTTREAASDRGSQQPFSRRVLSEPLHPKSALEALVTEAKEGRETSSYGDETMASLENILNPTTEPTNSTLTNDPTPKKEEDPEQGNLTQTEKDRRQEKLALEAMSKRLTSTSSSLKDANKGLRRIENRIEGVTGESNQATASQTNPGPTASKPVVHVPDASSTMNSTTVCSHCGRGDVPLWLGLWTELRNNFYTYDSTKQIHLTWLGWSVILWWVWFLLENALCFDHCNYVDGPVVPFVTFHLAVRPFTTILRPLFGFLAWSSGALFNSLFGDLVARSKPATATASIAKDTIGYQGVWDTTTRFLTATATRAVQSAMEAIDETGALWDDDVAF